MRGLVPLIDQQMLVIAARLGWPESDIRPLPLLRLTHYYEHLVPKND
jgi:hypothetical protein